MKNLFLLLFIFLTSLQIQAQTPQKMTYQAVIRDGAGQLMKNRNIGMQISVLQGSESGSIVFAERFFPSTNENGLVTVEIGDGLSVNGSFSSIDWKNGPYFIKTETDVNGGANYTLSATSQLLSIPYALLAKDVENVPSLKMDDLTDVNATNIQPGQLLKWDGTQWNPANDATTGGPGTTYTPGAGINIDINNVITNTGDLSNINEIQQLELAGNQLKLTGANTVTLPTGTTYAAGAGISLNNNTITNTGDNDNDATNEFQQITLSGTVLTLSDGGGSVVLPTGNGGGGGDNWGTQTVETNPALSGNGTQANPLDIANGGVTPEKLSEVGANNNDAFIFDANTSNWVIRKPVNIQEGNGVQVISTSTGPLNYIINALDASPSNEIQTLSLNGSNLSLSQNGGTVTLPSLGDNWGSQTVAVQSALNGNGTSSNPIGIANGGITTSKISTAGANLNDAIIYDGNQWVIRKPVNITVTSNSGLGVMNVQGGPLSFQLNNNLWTNLTEGQYFMNLEKMSLGAHSGAPEVLLGGLCRYFEILPTDTDFRKIGRSTLRWDKIYVNSIVGGKSEGDWLPTVSGNMDLGSTVFKWDKLFTNTIVSAKHEGDWLPTTSGMDLGSSSLKWDKLYIENIEGATQINGNFSPISVLNLLGTPSFKWAAVWSNTGTIQTSDKRLKKNILPSTYGILEVMNLKPVTWEWKNERQAGTYMGFIAQDLLEVVPNAVYVPSDEDYKEYELAKAAGKSPEEPSYGIKYAELIPVLTKAIQEQQVMIEEQQKQILSLISRLEKIENK